MTTFGRPTAPKRAEMVEIAGQCWRSSPEVYAFFDGLRRIELPRSLCRWVPERRVMVLPAWLARRKGMWG